MNEIHLLWIHIYCTGQVTVGDNTRARLTSQLSHLESHRVKPESSITEKTHMRSNRTLHIIGLHLVHTTSVFRFCLNETATASTKSFTDDGQNSDSVSYTHLVATFFCWLVLRRTILLSRFGKSKCHIRLSVVSS